MKKNPLIFIVIILIVGLGLYLLMINKNNSNNFINQSQKTLNNVVKETKEKTAEKIQDLISQNINLKCSYETPSGTKVTTYIQRKDKMRSVIETKSGENHVLFLNGKMYSWSEKTKQGMIMNVKTGIENKTAQQKPEIIEDPKKYLDELEKFKADCRKENFSESLFQIPNDVKFQDVDKIQEMMEKGNFQMPTITKEEAKIDDE